MCDLINNLTEQSVTGYKVALQHKKNKRFYSSAMGFQYRRGPVPIITKQIRLCTLWRNNILSSVSLYKNNMIGRTAIYENIEDAEDLAKNITSNTPLVIYDVVILKMTISNNIMEGYYAFSEVYAGKNIVKYKKVLTL